MKRFISILLFGALSTLSAWAFPASAHITRVKNTHHTVHHHAHKAKKHHAPKHHHHPHAA